MCKSCCHCFPQRELVGVGSYLRVGITNWLLEISSTWLNFCGKLYIWFFYHHPFNPQKAMESMLTDAKNAGL
jgi:hypothetical protein